MLLRAFFTDVLPDLQLAQAPNQPRSKDEAEKHGGQARVDGSNGDVAKNIQRAEVTLQDVVEEVVKHLVPYLLLRNLAGSGIARQQRLDDPFHLHAARTFHEKRI